MTRTYNFPLDEQSFESMAYKNFSEETQKRIHWVRKMYSEWRDVHNFNHG